MSKTTLQTIALLVALGCIVASVPFMWSYQSSLSRTKTDPRTAGLEVGASMPEIHGSGWFNGSEEEAQKWGGKVIFVHAWANFCPKCHDGMPDLVKLHEEFKDKGVVFVGVTPDASDKMDEDQQTAELDGVKKYIAKYHAEWPMAYGAMDTLIAFKAEFIPGYWVVGRDGKVLWNRAASDKESLREALERALAAADSAPAASGSPDTQSGD